MCWFLQACSSVASPICQEGQSERTFLIFPFLPDIFPLFPDFSLFFLIFGKFFAVMGRLYPRWPPVATPLQARPYRSTPKLTRISLMWNYDPASQIFLPKGYPFHWPTKNTHPFHIPLAHTTTKTWFFTNCFFYLFLSIYLILWPLSQSTRQCHQFENPILSLFFSACGWQHI